MASAFDQIADSSSSGEVPEFLIRQLSTRLGIGWSDRASRVVSEELVRLWTLRDERPEPITTGELERAARLAQLLEDDFTATDILIELARRDDLTPMRRRVAARQALAHASLAGREHDPRVVALPQLVDELTAQSDDQPDRRSDVATPAQTGPEPVQPGQAPMQTGHASMQTGDEPGETDHEEDPS
jgi:hypothetical protein